MSFDIKNQKPKSYRNSNECRENIRRGQNGVAISKKDFKVS